jgi:hypothetical protein
MNETIKEYTKTIKLFGRDHEVKVLIKTEHDDDFDIDDMDCTDKERQEIYDKLDNHDLCCLVVWVIVSSHLFSGHDCISGTFINHLNRSDYIAEIERTVEDYSLLEEAIESYREEATRYKEFFDGIKEGNNG